MAQQPRPLQLAHPSAYEVQEFGLGQYAAPTARAFSRRRAMQWSKDRASSPPTWSSVGTPVTMGAVGANTRNNGDGATGSYELCQTAASSGDSQGVITSATVAEARWNPTLTFAILVAASSSSIGEWHGFTSVDVAGVDGPTTQHLAMIRFNTAASDTTTWRAVTCDGGGTPTVVNGSVNHTINSRYYGCVEVDSVAAEVRFWLTDSSTGLFVNLATIATTLPGSSTGLYIESVVTAKAATLKRTSPGWFRLEHD